MTQQNISLTHHTSSIISIANNRSHENVTICESSFLRFSLQIKITFFLSSETIRRLCKCSQIFLFYFRVLKSSPTTPTFEHFKLFDYGFTYLINAFSCSFFFASIWYIIYLQRTDVS